MHYNKTEWEMYRNKSLHPKKIEEMDEHLLQCDKCFEIFESTFEENTETKNIIKKKRFKRTIAIVAVLTIALTGFLQTSHGQHSLAAVAKIFDSVKSSISEFFGEDYKELTTEENKLSLKRDDINIEITETAADKNAFYFLTYMQSDKFKNIDTLLLRYKMKIISKKNINTGGVMFFDLKNGKDPLILKHDEKNGSISFVLPVDIFDYNLSEKFTVDLVIDSVRMLKDDEFKNLRENAAATNDLNFRFEIDGEKALSNSKEIPIDEEFVYKNRNYSIKSFNISPFNTNIILSTGIDLVDDWRKESDKLLKENNIVFPETPEIGTDETYEEMLIHASKIKPKTWKKLEEINTQLDEKYMENFIVEVFDENNRKYDFNQSLAGSDLEKTYLNASLKNMKEFEELLKAKNLDIKIYEKVYNEKDSTKGGLLYSTSLNIK